MRLLSDFSVGQTFKAGPVDVTAEEIMSFARRYDPQPFHLDPETARRTFFRGLAASGWMTSALTMRLLLESGFDIPGGMIGREIEAMKWLQPVRPGDRLCAVSEVLGVEPSATNPKWGWVRFKTETINQKDEIVQSMIGVVMAPTRA